MVTNNLDVGGTERHLLQVLPRLAETRPVRVLTTKARGPLAGPMEAAGVPVLGPSDRVGWAEKGRLARLLTLARAGARVFRVVRADRDVIVHCFLPASYLIGGLAALAAGARVPVMSRRSLNLYQRRHPVVRRMEHWLHARMRLILGNAQAVVDQLHAEEGVERERLRLIRNGIDPTRFSVPVDTAALRADLEVPQDAVMLILVANLIGYKGHADLLAALGQVAERLPRPWRLVCVGRDEGIGGRLRDQASAAGLTDSIIWTGERDDVPALLRAADIGLLVSHEEGFSNAVLEGLWAGLPMIVTDVGGNAEAVEDGVTGHVVAPRAPAALGAAIAGLAGDPVRRAAMGRRARAVAEDRFALDTCVAAYEALYAALDEDRVPPP